MVGATWTGRRAQSQEDHLQAFLFSLLISDLMENKKEDTVSLSSAEAEYPAVTYLTKELFSVKQLLADFCVSPPVPMRLHSDSISAIAFCQPGSNM